MLTLNLLILLLGIFSSCLILWSVPLLKGKNLPLSQDLNLSIIIPARNEADNLPILLTSLSNQSFKPLEVIVVDDDSKDQTASLARQYGARVVHVPAEEKWVGKSAACWAGAKEAEGDYLLFLDADIFLADSKSLEKILSQFKKGDSAGLLSIQPYHVIEKPYENLSAIFNIMVVAGMNAFSFFKNQLEPAGAFGPSLLCQRTAYFRLGGHKIVQGSLMENIDLGKHFIQQGFPVELYGGKGVLHFRMYPQGFQELALGWSKSFASASLSTHPLILISSVFWITAGLSALVFPVYFLIISNFSAFNISLLGYLIFAGYFYRMTSQVGQFHWLAVLTYPILFAFFVGLYAWSFIKTFIFKKVSWKGRDLTL